MAESDNVAMGQISYFWRNKLYRHMQQIARDFLDKYPNDRFLVFTMACSSIMEDKTQTAIRELQSLKDQADMNLCSYLALISAYRASKVVDQDAIQSMDQRLKTERKQAGEKSLFFAGYFLFQSGKYEKAREYIDRCVKQSGAIEAFSLKGWNELYSKRDDGSRAEKAFEDALRIQPKFIDALLGKAKLLENSGNTRLALDSISRVVAAFPSVIIGYVEKMKNSLAQQDWEQAVDGAHRCLEKDDLVLDAHVMLILNLICRDGDYHQAAQRIADLLELVQRVEPKNYNLYVEYASLFSTLCGRNSAVLEQTLTIIETALSFVENPPSSLLIERGRQLLLYDDRVKEAMKAFRAAMKLDESSVEALTGVIECQLLDGQIEDAKQQLEFLQETQQNGDGLSARLLYLNAVLSRKMDLGPEIVTSLLTQATDKHFSLLNDMILSTNKLLQLDADFVLKIVNEFLLQVPQEAPPPGQQQSIHPVLKKCSTILEGLTRTVPGLLEAIFLTAKVKFLSGETDAAQGTLKLCLGKDQTFSDAHILLAQIFLQREEFERANQSLEVGLSHNFQVRDHPLYHLIKARICRKSGDNEEAVKLLQTALSLPGVRKKPESASNPDRRRRRQVVPQTRQPITTSDRVSVFLELAEANRLLGNQHEAAKTMNDAINEFKGTPEEIRIMISTADLSISSGDVEGALGLLRGIAKDQPYFVEARKKMAEIYLNYRKDKRLYASCYRELVEKNPSLHTQLLLGDAYMNIQEPEKAIEVYEQALRKNPRDSSLASKIGQALVKTHQYSKAISYYEAAIRAGGQSVLLHELAELLIRLRHYDKAEKILRQALDNDHDNSLQSMIDESHYLGLLAKVHHKQGKTPEAVKDLISALELQSRVLKRVPLEQPDSLTVQQKYAASLCCELAEHFCHNHEEPPDRAIDYYKQALTYSENDVRIMLQLAQLYMKTEQLDACERMCMVMLKDERENDAATMMMADLMFQKQDYEKATYHFTRILEKSPAHYGALSRLVDLKRRAGDLEAVPHFFDNAIKAMPRAALDGGFNYCKGLFEWYSGNPTSALMCFNKARNDTDWGYQALCCMIEICLNPDNNTIGGEVFEAVDQGKSTDHEKATSDQMALSTANKLIKELKPKPGDMRSLVLSNMWLIATKQKTQVDRALHAFTEMVQVERQSVAAVYGTAAAYMVLKQTARARSQLKTILKNVWTLSEADDLEKAWLLLADIYVQANKFDSANELLNRCLQHNKSCCKAYEYLGFIKEKDQKYPEAANNYLAAWKYSNKNNPNIGYKLAFCYLKSKAYTDAIDVSHHILTAHPNYPKIRQDVLEKARLCIRT